MICIVPFAFGAYLILQGKKNIPLFPVIDIDPISPFMYIKLPIIIGSLLILFTLWSLISNIGKEISITPKTFTYKKGRYEFTCFWKNLTFTPPRYDKKRFKMFSVSDGKRSGRIEEFFFPEFATIVEVIKAGKASAGSEYSVDL